MAKSKNQTPAHLKIDWSVFISRFNASLKHYGSAIPELKYLSKGKKAQAQRIVNEAGTQDILIDAVVNMMKSDFCNGRVRTQKYPTGWLASFFWLLDEDENVYKLANDKFKNPDPAELTPDEQRQLEQERYRAQQDARRAEARRIDEEERERRERERDERARNCVSYEAYQRMKAQGLITDKF